MNERFAANSNANPVIFSWDLIYHLRNGTLLFLNSIKAYKLRKLSLVIPTRKNCTPDINKREFEFMSFHSYCTVWGVTDSLASSRRSRVGGTCEMAGSWFFPLTGFIHTSFPSLGGLQRSLCGAISSPVRHSCLWCILSSKPVFKKDLKHCSSRL